MTLSAQDAIATIAEMEKNTPQQIKMMRSHTRIAVRAKVVAQPANTSERKRFCTEGILGDISQGGCLILFADPLRVGDMYRLSFDRSVLDLEPLIARCVRCRLVREDSFEAGFSFFQTVNLSAFEKREGDSLFD